MGQPKQRQLKVTEVTFKPAVDAERRLRRVMELLLAAANARREGKDGHTDSAESSVRREESYDVDE